MKSLAMAFLGLWLVVGMAAPNLWAGGGSELAYVAGIYQGQAVLGKVVDGRTAPGEATPVEAELKQKAQRLSGLLSVGETKADKIVLQISRGKVEGNHLWFEGDELLWKARFSGYFVDGKIKGQVLFTSQDPTKKLFGASKLKFYTPTQMGGPLEMTRQQSD